MNLRFLLAGFLCIALDFCVYSLGFNLLGPEISKAAGYVAGAVLGFVLNRTFTFNHHGPVGLAMFRFAALYVASLALNVSTVSLTLSLSQDWSLGPPFAFIVATTLSTLANYLGQRFWVFNGGNK